MSICTTGQLARLATNAPQEYWFVLHLNKPCAGVPEERANVRVPVPADRGGQRNNGDY